MREDRAISWDQLQQSVLSKLYYLMINGAQAQVPVRKWIMGGGGSWEEVDHGRKWIMGGSGSWEEVDHGRRWIMGGSGSWEEVDHGRKWIMGGSGSWEEVDHGRKWIMGGGAVSFLFLSG